MHPNLHYTEHARLLLFPAGLERGEGCRDRPYRPNSAMYCRYLELWLPAFGPGPRRPVPLPFPPHGPCHRACQTPPRSFLPLAQSLPFRFTKPCNFYPASPIPFLFTQKKCGVFFKKESVFIKIKQNPVNNLDRLPTRRGWLR